MDVVFYFVLCITNTVALLSGNTCNDSVCSQFVLPTEPFQSKNITIAIVDTTLRSVICPLPEWKFVLFECSHCNCNLTLEVFRQCFGDTPFCDALSNCTDCPFTYQCEEQLKLYCSSHTFPTRPSTTTTGTSTTVVTSSTTIDTQKTTTDNPYIPPKYVPTFKPSIKAVDKSDNSAKSAVVAVCVLSVVCVIGATVGVYLYKQRRRRARVQIQQHKDNVIPLQGVFRQNQSYTEIDTTDEVVEDKKKLETIKSDDSGVVCNVDVNHSE